jgi:hypothetical protein
MHRHQVMWLVASTLAAATIITATANPRQSATSVQDVRVVNSKTPFLEKIDLVVGQATAGSFSTQDIKQIFEVPTGKRLVIEHASAQSDRSVQIDFAIFLGGTATGSTKKIYLSYAPQTPFASKGIFSQPMRLYADPGSKVEVLGEFNVLPQKIVTRPVYCRVTLSGYLEDVP